MTRPTPLQSAGFTLIELAIVVAILGLISVGFLKLVGTLREQTARTDTELTLDASEDALRRFLLANGRLPCPASAALRPGEDDYGKEAFDGGSNSCDGSKVNAIPNIALVAQGGFRGVVPTSTLRVSHDRTADGWARQITYMVTANAVRLDAFSSETWAPTINVYPNAASIGDASKRIRAPAVVLLMSHGPNGFGASTVDGGLLPNPPADSDAEWANLDIGDANFVAANPDIPDAPFDDIVRTYSERELIEPLIAEGALEDRTVTARRQMRHIAAALVAFAVGDTADPDGAPTGEDGCLCNATPPTPTCDSGCARTIRHALPAADFNQDGWGEPGWTNGFVPYAELGFTIAERIEIDPWGGAIRYRVRDEAIASSVTVPPVQVGLYSTATAQFSGPVFRLLSFGPDGLPDTDTDSFGCNTVPIAPADDLCLEMNLRVILGQMVSSSVPID